MKNMKTSRFQKDWDEEWVRKILTHYESQTEEEAVAEDETAKRLPKRVMIAKRASPNDRKTNAERQFAIVSRLFPSC